MTRVVIVEDHTLVRQSLVKTVESEAGFEVAGQAGRGDEGIEVIKREKPDVVVLDITMPGGTGLDVAAQMRTAAPDTRFLFLTMHDDDATISKAISLGADGYVLKTASTDELLTALHAVADGGSYLSPAVARRVLDFAGGKAPGATLTERELEILRLLSTGARPAQIASSLFVSIKTVKNHLTSVYAKLGVQTGAQAVAEAYRRGLVSLPMES
ncbi:MAG TPA: response regulator transcription factor [Actinomycetota bacterium]